METEMEIIMLKIYVIYHNHFADTNVFLTNSNDIKDTIKELAHKSETDVKEWHVKEIMENVPFKANMKN
jgi:hypothetical protein